MRLKMKMENKMEKLAGLFGKKLGEKFDIHYSSMGMFPVYWTAQFTENGFDLVNYGKLEEQIVNTGKKMGMTEARARDEAFREPARALEQLLCGLAEYEE